MYEFKFFADGIFLYRSVDLDAVAVDLDAVVNAIICFCGDGKDYNFCWNSSVVFLKEPLPGLLF